MRKRSELIQSVMDYVISEIKYLSPTNVEKILAVWDDMEDDELVEITPEDIRIRKKYLTEIDRRRHAREIGKIESEM